MDQKNISKHWKYLPLGRGWLGEEKKIPGFYYVFDHHLISWTMCVYRSDKNKENYNATYKKFMDSAVQQEVMS